MDATQFDEEMHRHIARWRTAFPLLPALAIAPISQVMERLVPDGGPAVRATQVAMALWTVAFDDLLDQATAEGHSPLEMVASCRANLGGGSDAHASRGFGYDSALLTFREVLRPLPSWESVGALWGKSLARLINGSLYEYHLAGCLAKGGSLGSAGSFERYLAHARWSIAFPWLAVAALCFCSEVDRAALGAIERVVARCGGAVRLANDLASYPREKLEGVVNAVVLLGLPLGAQSQTQPDALVVAIRRRRDLELGRAGEWAKQCGSMELQASRIVEAARLSIALYDQMDIRLMGGGSAA